MVTIFLLVGIHMILTTLRLTETTIHDGVRITFNPDASKESTQVTEMVISFNNTTIQYVTHG